MANLTQHDVVTATAAALTAGIAGVTVYPWRMLALSDDLLPAVVVHCFDRQETPRTVEVQNSQWRSVDTVHIECHNRASSDAAAGQEASRLADAVKDALWASQAWADEWETVSPMRTRLVLDEGTGVSRSISAAAVSGVYSPRTIRSATICISVTIRSHSGTLGTASARASWPLKGAI